MCAHSLKLTSTSQCFTQSYMSKQILCENYTIKAISKREFHKILTVGFSFWWHMRLTPLPFHSTTGEMQRLQYICRVCDESVTAWTSKSFHPLFEVKSLSLCYQRQGGRYHPSVCAQPASSGLHSSSFVFCQILRWVSILSCWRTLFLQHGKNREEGTK